MFNKLSAYIKSYMEHEDKEVYKIGQDYDVYKEENTCNAEMIRKQMKYIRAFAQAIIDSTGEDDYKDTHPIYLCRGNSYE